MSAEYENKTVSHFLPAQTARETESKRTIVSLSSAIDSQFTIPLVDLSTLNLCERLNRAQSRVLRKRQRDRVQGRREPSHRVLLNRRDRVGRLHDGDRACDFGRSSSVNDTVVLNQVSNDTECVVQGTFRLVDDLYRVRKKWGLGRRNRGSGNRRQTILLLPRTNTVTALELAQSSTTSILSLVVPNEISLTIPACPNFSAVRSSNRGTMRPFVAIAMSWQKESSSQRKWDKVG